MNDLRCGAVAIIGRPNVGKSTYLNHAIGQKISITSRKPQTTRHQILGVKTVDTTQIIYVDTPGLQANPDRALNRGMNKSVLRAISEVDVLLFLVEAGKWTEADQNVLKMVQQTRVPTILIINKIDKLDDRSALLPYIEQLSAQHTFDEVIPTIARTGENIESVEAAILRFLPEGVHWFPEDQVTDRSMRFIAAELIREKLFRRLGDELPYRLTVTIDQFKEEAGLTHIMATIWVERQGQKKIVIGKKGAGLKAVGEQARQELESMLEQKVFLETWVKVREKWSDDVRALTQFGLGTE